MKAYQIFESKQTLFESYGLRDPYFRHWEREVHPLLLEVAMDPAKIQQMFQQIEKAATDAGDNRTTFGKIADVPGKVKELWFDKLGGALQNSDIVKGFDEKWEKIKTDVGAKYPKLADALSKYKAFADKNPKTQKFLLAVAASVAASVGVAAAGGVGAGALAVGTGAGVATAIVNIADRLLKNEKLSTAVGRGATAGIVAGLTAGLAAKLTDMISAGFKADALGTVADNKIFRGYFEYNGVPTSAIGREADVDALSAAFSAADWGKFYSLLEKMRSPEYLESLELGRKLAKQAIDNYAQTASVLKDLSKIAAAASGAVGTAAAGAGEKDKKESREFTNRQIKTIIEWCDGTPSMLMEADPAGAEPEKKPGFFSRLGKNLTTKVTADKLEKAWNKAGSPTDSDQVADVMRKAGVSDEILAPIFKSLGVELGQASQGDQAQDAGSADQAQAAGTLDFKTLQAAVAQLRTRDAQSLLKFIDGIDGGGKVSPNAKFWKQGKHSSGNPFRGNDKFDDQTGEPIPPEFQNNRPAADTAPEPETQPAATKSNVKITGRKAPKPKIAVAV